ncbi:MAG: hypothetical protein KDC67_13565, partial [Ignavibacteriae bacterium]|nr:hypothetical protein [Ignavibacteriota bacterium]
LILILFLSKIIFAQVDITDTTKTPINIGGNDTSVDSAKTKPLRSQNSFKPVITKNYSFLSTFTRTKKEIDFDNYRNNIDIITALPATSQFSFGLIGQPNQAVLYNQTKNNFSLAENNFSLFNRWNGSNNFNLLQAENISSIEIIPLTRGFLIGSNSNSAVININTRDSITSKPLTRLRYYQAANDESFLDAMFSARILNDLSLFFRISNSTFSNSSNSGIYKNLEYGVWQANLKSIYRFSDKLFASVEYYHHKSNTELNGGIDLTSLAAASLSLQSGLFNNLSPVNFNDRNKTVKMNKVSTELYGNLFKNSFTKLNITYDFTEELFKQYLTDTLTNGTRINNSNYYSYLSTSLRHEQSFEHLVTKFSLGLDAIDYNIDQISYYDKKNSYYLSALAEYSVLDSLLIPAVFFKVADYENQKTNGFGFDLKFNFNNYFRIMSGISNFNRPYLLTEMHSLPQNNLEKNYITNYFVTGEFILDELRTSITYFNIEADNAPVPIYNNENIQLGSSQIIFPFTEKTKSEGINIFSNLRFWKLETLFNGNYILSNDQSFIPRNGKYNLTAGIYYRDILFDNNLDLKTGFNFFYADNTDYQIYDFQSMTSASYYLSGNTYSAFSSFGLTNTPYRLDFTLAGRIQDRATFYFAYENITG